MTYTLWHAFRLRSERQLDSVRKEMDEIRKKYEDAASRVESLQKMLDGNDFNKSEILSKLQRAEEALERGTNHDFEVKRN